MSTMIILMTFSFVLCLRSSSRAADVAKFSWDVAHENQQNRLGKSNKEEYTQAKLFKHVLKYLIYPKIQDIQKPALIIIGFLYWVIYNGAQISIEKIWKLVLAMFIFDFLAYQARYQINDIRGIEEDREFEHKNRLLPEKRDNKYELHIVKFSFVVAGLKILLSVGITIILIICKGIYGWFLLICLGILFLSSILYEIVRDTYMYWLIFVCVGIGYPLRFSLGFFVVNPGDFQLMWGMPLICFLFALWAYGS